LQTHARLSSVPGFTVNKVCASGMKAVALAAQAIACGEHDIVVAGGMECMSAAPFLLRKARWGYRLGDDTLVDALLGEALHDPTEGCHMGVTAENLATEYGITRAAQDQFAVASQQKAGAALVRGAFGAEIVPVPVPQRRGEPLTFAVDEFPRPETTVAALSRLHPAFAPDGTVTAGNASGINDGAAAMVLLAREEAERRGITPQATVLSWASAGVEPSRMGMGPVPASRAALARAGLSLADMDCVEVNEAFAAQALAVLRHRPWSPRGCQRRSHPGDAAAPAGRPPGRARPGHTVRRRRPGDGHGGAPPGLGRRLVAAGHKPDRGAG
jgi:acetyl-CoA C-acetyltransferase